MLVILVVDILVLFLRVKNSNIQFKGITQGLYIQYHGSKITGLKIYKIKRSDLEIKNS